MMRSILAVSMLLVILGGVVEGTNEVDLGQGTRRKVASTDWDTLWVRGGPRDDAILAQPLKMAAFGDLLIVLDPGQDGITALRISDGTLVWRYSRRGDGPGELRNPVAMTVMPNGQIAVADASSHRLTVIDSSGRFVHTSMHQRPSIDALCAIDRDLLLSFGGMASVGFAIINVRSGKTVREVPSPWRATPSSDHFVLQGQLSPDSADGDCVFAETIGSRFALFRSGDRLWEAEYIEPIAAATPPRPGRPPDASAISTSIRGDTVIVSFDGRTRDRRKLIDFYSRRDGRYLKSVVTPRNASWMTRSRDTYFVLHGIDGYPAISALRMRGTPTVR